MGKVVIEYAQLPKGAVYEHLEDVVNGPRPVQIAIDEGVLACVQRVIEVKREVMLRREKRLDSLMGWMVFCIFALLCVGVGVGIKLI